jgi:hypothetical protein
MPRAVAKLFCGAAGEKSEAAGNTEWELIGRISDGHPPSPQPSPPATVLVGKLKFIIFKDMVHEERENHLAALD